MTVNIAIEMITGRILHPFIQFHQFGILCRHIDLDICRNPLALVREPFDQAGITQGRYSHGLILVVDLAVPVIYLKLRDHIHHTSHLSVSQDRCGISVKQRNLIK